METDIVFRNESGVAVTTSSLVAETFGKEQYTVVRDIDNLVLKLKEVDNQCPTKLSGHQQMFSEYYEDVPQPNGGVKPAKRYFMTKDGFTLLVMGYTGKKAMEFKLKYIAAFNAMERTIREGAQIPNQFMQTQMQMMQQMMNLCNTMIQCMGQMSAVPAVQPTSGLDTTPRHRTPVVRVPKKPGVLIGYSRLRREYPGYITGTAATKVLRKRGVDVSSGYLFEYMRRNKYILSDNEWFNCPSDDSVRNGYMIGITGCGDYGRTFHTPYLSPSFVDLLEKELREKGIGVPRQLTIPIEKEEQI